jgi:hypothetical protein
MFMESDLKSSYNRMSQETTLLALGRLAGCAFQHSCMISHVLLSNPCLAQMSGAGREGLIPWTTAVIVE